MESPNAICASGALMTTEAIYTHVARTPKARVRPEAGDTYLIYHPETDELHLVSGAGKAIFELCDGRAIDDVVEEGAALIAGDRNAAELEVLAFLQRLHKRSLVAFQ
jgi:hypothetical protein